MIAGNAQQFATIDGRVIPGAPDWSAAVSSHNLRVSEQQIVCAHLQLASSYTRPMFELRTPARWLLRHAHPELAHAEQRKIADQVVAFMQQFNSTEIATATAGAGVVGTFDSGVKALVCSRCEPARTYQFVETGVNYT